MFNFFAKLKNIFSVSLLTESKIDSGASENPLEKQNLQKLDGRTVDIKVYDSPSVSGSKIDSGASENPVPVKPGKPLIQIEVPEPRAPIYDSSGTGEVLPPPKIKTQLVQPKKEGKLKTETELSFISWYKFYLFSSFFADIKKIFFSDTLQKKPQKGFFVEKVKKEQKKISSYELGYIIQQEFPKIRLVFDKPFSIFDIGRLTSTFQVIFPGKTDDLSPVGIAGSSVVRAPIRGKLTNDPNIHRKPLRDYEKDLLSGSKKSIPPSRVLLAPNLRISPLFFFGGLYVQFFKLPNGLICCYIGETATSAGRFIRHADNALDGTETILRRIMPNSNPEVPIETIARLLSLTFEQIYELIDLSDLKTTNTGFWLSVFAIYENLKKLETHNSVIHYQLLRLFERSVTKEELRAFEMMYVYEFIKFSTLNGRSFSNLTDGFVDGPCILITEVPMPENCHKIELRLFEELYSLSRDEVQRLDQSKIRKLYEDAVGSVNVPDLYI